MNYLKYLADEIHTVVVATTDNQGLPVTCAIDMMDADENGLYFLTAKGKNFYDRLKKCEHMALTGMKGNDTMSCAAISIRGKVCELGRGLLSHLFEKNPYMYKIYPTEQSRTALTVFKLYQGSGEWFDLSKKPIERTSFPLETQKLNWKNIILQMLAQAAIYAKHFVHKAALILPLHPPL